MTQQRTQQAGDTVGREPASPAVAPTPPARALPRARSVSAFQLSRDLVHFEAIVDRFLATELDLYAVDAIAGPLNRLEKHLLKRVTALEQAEDTRRGHR